MERLISLWKALVNTYGTSAANLLDLGSLLRQSDAPADILSSLKVDELLKNTSTIGSGREPMSIGDGDILKYIGSSQAAAAQALQNQLYQQAQQAQNWQISNQVGPQISTPNSRAYDLLTLRLAGVKGAFKLALGDFLICHYAAEIVYVFFVFNGRSGHIEEQADIFPSDKLITQLRLIMS